MKTLRLSGFGMRGFVGDSLSLRGVMDYAAAFAAFVEGRPVALARDTRYSSPMLRSAVGAALVGAGCEVIDLGVCPTPVLQFAVPRLGAAGGVALSGGHHPAGWNAVMLIGADGAPLDPHAGEQVLDFYHAGAFHGAAWDGLGAVRLEPEAARSYVAALAGFLDAASIRAAGFRVMADPVGGAGCALLAPLGEALGLEVVAVNGEPGGYLAREPEPRPRSARPLAAMIGPLRGDAGFVFSSDVGRVSLVTEKGDPVSEEYVFALVADHLLRKRRGPLVTNGCTSRMIDDLAAAAGVPLSKTAVGQAHVMARLADEDGMAGGEGSGSAAVPAFSRAFDGFLAMGLVLEAMAVRGEPLSGLVASLPRYHIVKRSVRCRPGAGYRALDTIRGHLPPGLEAGRPDRTDGLRLDYDDGWVHVRASRTEAIVRVISEARDRARAEGRADALVGVLEQRL